MRKMTAVIALIGLLFAGLNAAQAQYGCIFDSANDPKCPGYDPNRRLQQLEERQRQLERQQRQLQIQQENAARQRYLQNQQRKHDEAGRMLYGCAYDGTCQSPR